LAAVAGLACAVFVADRVLMGGALSGPQSAQAAGAPVAKAAPASAPAAPAPGAAITTTAPVGFAVGPAHDSLAQRLERAGRGLPAETPDAFRPSSQWKQAASTDAKPKSEAFDPQAFARRHHLDAVFNSGGRSRAMIAGQPLLVGDTREGMTLKQIGDRWVVWEGHGITRTVHLDPRP